MLLNSLAPTVFDDRQAVLVDMDGVLVYGADAAPGAAAFVSKFKDRLFVVTNESAYTPEELSARLSHRSLQIPPNRLVAAGPIAIDKLKCERSDANILIRGAPGLHALAEIAGIRTVRRHESIDVVLLGRDPDFDVTALETIVRAVEDGAELWVTNPDLRHPIEDGRYTFQTGALLQAVLACLDDVPVTVIGKPQPALFKVALSRLDAHPEDAVMIGDNPRTDGAGALAAGIPFVLVGSAPDASAANLEALLQKNGQ